MRVHWLNAELTEAFVERGWFRKRVARVSKDRYGDWNFTDTGRSVGYSTEQWLRGEVEAEFARVDAELKRRADELAFGKEWVPVKRKLPKATVVRG